VIQRFSAVAAMRSPRGQRPGSAGCTSVRAAAPSQLVLFKGQTMKDAMQERAGLVLPISTRSVDMDRQVGIGSWLLDLEMVTRIR
jgi:hypothetical protein